MADTEVNPLSRRKPGSRQRPVRQDRPIRPGRGNRRRARRMDQTGQPATSGNSTCRSSGSGTGLEAELEAVLAGLIPQDVRRGPGSARGPAGSGQRYPTATGARKSAGAAYRQGHRRARQEHLRRPGRQERGRYPGRPVRGRNSRARARRSRSSSTTSTRGGPSASCGSRARRSTPTGRPSAKV